MAVHRFLAQRHAPLSYEAERVMEPRTTTTEVHGFMIQVMDRQLDAAEAARMQPFGEPEFASSGGLGAFGLMPQVATNDSISRMLPPGLGSTSQLGPLGGLLGMLSGTSLLAPLGGLMQQIGSLLAQIFGGGNSFGGVNAFGGGASGLPGGDEQYFTNANGGSVGDPHLSFNGRAWDNMQSQNDLIHSDSIPGGYQVSTVTTPPNAHGITYNERATVTTNNGLTSVSLDKDGNAAIDENGTAYPLQPGTTYDLGNGEMVTRNNDGSVNVTCDNGNGGQITTTMRSNGTGVDVNASANNVDLGGALVDGAPSPAPMPSPTPLPQPIRYEPLLHARGNTRVEPL